MQSRQHRFATTVTVSPGQAHLCIALMQALLADEAKVAQRGQVQEKVALQVEPVDSGGMEFGEGQARRGHLRVHTHSAQWSNNNNNNNNNTVIESELGCILIGGDTSSVSQCVCNSSPGWSRCRLARTRPAGILCRSACINNTLKTPCAFTRQTGW